jgi:hypothetical protein
MMMKNKKNAKEGNRMTGPVNLHPAFITKASKLPHCKLKLRINQVAPP